jgi:hypothetical protein
MQNWGKTSCFQAFFLDQDKPNQGRKVKSWRPRQKESAHESQTGTWWAASSGLKGTFQERAGLTSRQRMPVLGDEVGVDIPGV